MLAEWLIVVVNKEMIAWEGIHCRQWWGAGDSSCVEHSLPYASLLLDSPYLSVFASEFKDAQFYPVCNPSRDPTYLVAEPCARLLWLGSYTKLAEGLYELIEDPKILVFIEKQKNIGIRIVYKIFFWNYLYNT